MTVESVSNSFLLNPSSLTSSFPEGFKFHAYSAIQAFSVIVYSFSFSSSSPFLFILSAFLHPLFLHPLLFSILFISSSPGFESPDQYPQFLLSIHSSKRLLVETLPPPSFLLADAIISLTLSKGQRHEVSDVQFTLELGGIFLIFFEFFWSIIFLSLKVENFSRSNRSPFFDKSTRTGKGGHDSVLPDKRMGWIGCCCRESFV